MAANINVKSLVAAEIAAMPRGNTLTQQEIDSLTQIIESRVMALGANAQNPQLVQSIVSHVLNTYVNQALMANAQRRVAAPLTAQPQASPQTSPQASPQLPTPGMPQNAKGGGIFSGVWEAFSQNASSARELTAVLADLNQATQFLHSTFMQLIGPFMGAVNLVERFNEQMIQSQISYIIATNKTDELGIEITDFATRMEASRSSFKGLIEELEIETQTIVGLTSARLNNVLGNIIQESGKILPQYTEKSASSDEEFFKKLTGNISATLSLLKMPEFQDRQEIRALLSGNVSDPNAIMAMKLGISKAEVDKAKSQGTYGDLLLQKTQPFREASTLASGSLTNITSNIEEVLEQVQREFGAPILKQFTNIGEKVFSSLNSGPKEAIAATKMSANVAVLQVDKDLKKERDKLENKTISVAQKDEVFRNINRLEQSRESIISTAQTKLGDEKLEIFEGSFEERQLRIEAQKSEDAAVADPSILENLKKAAEEVGIVFGQVVDAVYKLTTMLADAFSVLGGIAFLDGVLKGFFGTISLVSKILSTVADLVGAALKSLEPFKSVISPFTALAGVITGSAAAVVTAVASVVLTIGIVNKALITLAKAAGSVVWPGAISSTIQTASEIKNVSSSIFKTAAENSSFLPGAAKLGQQGLQSGKNISSKLASEIAQWLPKALPGQIASGAKAAVGTAGKGLIGAGKFAGDFSSKLALGARSFASGGSLFASSALQSSTAMLSLSTAAGVIAGIFAAGAVIGAGLVLLWKNGIPSMANALTMFIAANQGAFKFLNIFAVGLRNTFDALIDFGNKLAETGDKVINAFGARSARQNEAETRTIASNLISSTTDEVLARSKRIREIAEENGLIKKNATDNERFIYAINSGGLTAESETNTREIFKRSYDLLNAIASGDEKAIREKSGGEIDGITFTAEEKEAAKAKAEALAQEYTALTKDKIDGETTPVKRQVSGEFGTEARAQIQSGFEVFTNTEKTLMTDIETRKNLKESFSGGIDRLNKSGVLGLGEIELYTAELSKVLANIGLEETERVEFLEQYNQLIEKELEITKKWAEATKKLSDARFQSGQISEAQNKRDKAYAEAQIAEAELEKELKAPRELKESSATSVLQAQTQIEVESNRATSGGLLDSKYSVSELIRQVDVSRKLKEIEGESFTLEEIGLLKNEKRGLAAELMPQQEFFAEAQSSFWRLDLKDPLWLENRINDMNGSVEREAAKTFIMKDESAWQLRSQLGAKSYSDLSGMKLDSEQLKLLASLMKEANVPEASTVLGDRFAIAGGYERKVLREKVLSSEEPEYASLRKKYKVTGENVDEVLQNSKFREEAYSNIRGKESLRADYDEKTFADKLNDQSLSIRKTFKELLFKDERLVKLRDSLGFGGENGERRFDDRVFSDKDAGAILNAAQSVGFKLGKAINLGLVSDEKIAQLNTRLLEAKDLTETLVLSVQIPDGEIETVRAELNEKLKTLNPTSDEAKKIKVQLEAIEELERVKNQIATDKQNLTALKGKQEPPSEEEKQQIAKLTKNIEFNEQRLKNAAVTREEKLDTINKDLKQEDDRRFESLAAVSAELAAKKKILQNEEIRLKYNKELTELLLKQLNAAEALASLELDAAVSFSPELYQSDIAAAKQEAALSKFLNKREDQKIAEEQATKNRFFTTSEVFNRAEKLSTAEDKAQFLNKSLKRTDITASTSEKYIKEAQGRSKALNELFSKEITLDSTQKTVKSLGFTDTATQINEKNYREVAERLSKAGSAIVQGGDKAQKGLDLIGVSENLRTNAVSFEEARESAKKLGVEVGDITSKQKLLNRLEVEYSVLTNSQENVKVKEEVSKATQEALVAEKEYVQAIDETIASLAKVESEINKRLTREAKINLQFGEVGIGPQAQLTEFERNIEMSLLEFEDAKTELRSFEKYFTKEQFVELADGNISPERLKELGEMAGLNETQFGKLSAAVGALGKVFEVLYNETSKYFDTLISVQKLQDKFADMGVGPMAGLSKEQRTLNIAMSEYETSLKKIAAYELSKEKTYNELTSKKTATTKTTAANALESQSRQWNPLDPKYIELVKNAAEAALGAIDAATKKLISRAEKYNNVLSKTIDVYSKMSSNANIFGEISADYSKIASTAAEKAGFNEEQSFLELSPEQRKNYVADEGILDFKKKQEEIEKRQELIAKKRELIEIKILQLKNRQLQIEQKMERAKILGDTSLDANTKKQLLAINSQMQKVVGDEGNMLKIQEFEKINVIELLRRQQNKELLSPKEIQAIQMEGLSRQETSLDSIYEGLSADTQTVEQDGFVESLETETIALEGEIGSIIEKLPAEALNKIGASADLEIADNTKLMAGYLEDIRDLLSGKKPKEEKPETSQTRQIAEKLGSKPTANSQQTTVDSQSRKNSRPQPDPNAIYDVVDSQPSRNSGTQPDPNIIYNYTTQPLDQAPSYGVDVPNTWRRMKKQKAYKMYDANGTLQSELDISKYLPGYRAIRPQQSAPQGMDLTSQLEASGLLENSRVREFTEKFLKSYEVPQELYQKQLGILTQQLQPQLQPKSQPKPLPQPQPQSQLTQTPQSKQRGFRKPTMFVEQQPPQPIISQYSRLMSSPGFPIAARIREATETPVTSLYSQLMFDPRNSALMQNERAKEFTESFLNYRGTIAVPSARAAQPQLPSVQPRLPSVPILRQQDVVLENSDTTRSREVFKQQKELFTGKTSQDSSLVVKLERGLSLLETIAEASTKEQKGEISLQIPAPSVMNKETAETFFKPTPMQQIRAGENLKVDDGTLREILELLREMFSAPEQKTDEKGYNIPGSSGGAGVLKLEQFQKDTNTISYGEELQAIISEIRNVIAAVRELELDPQIIFEPTINLDTSSQAKSSELSSAPVVPFSVPNENLSAAIVAQNQANYNKMI